MTSIRADMSQFYPMKATLEGLFGNRCYRRLKETASLRDWKAETDRLLRGIALAIEATVDVADEGWRREVREILELGRNHIKGANSVADLFAHLSATLTSSLLNLSPDSVDWIEGDCVE